MTNGWDFTFRIIEVTMLILYYVFLNNLSSITNFPQYFYIIALIVYLCIAHVLLQLISLLILSKLSNEYIDKITNYNVIEKLEKCIGSSVDLDRTSDFLKEKRFKRDHNHFVLRTRADRYRYVTYQPYFRKWDIRFHFSDTIDEVNQVVYTQNILFVEHDNCIDYTKYDIVVLLHMNRISNILMSNTTHNQVFIEKKKFTNQFCTHYFANEVVTYHLIMICLELW